MEISCSSSVFLLTYVLAWTAAKKCYRLGDLNRGNLVLTVPEAGRPKTRLLAPWDPWCDSSWLVDFCLLTVSSHGSGRGGAESKPFGVFSHKGTKSTGRAAPS